MKPFSALYFIKQNGSRTAALILVMSMTALCYLIGLYITNPFQENLINIEFYKDFAVIAPREDAESEKQFIDLLAERDNIENVSFVMDVDYYYRSPELNMMHVNYFSGILFDTILDIRSGVAYPVFHEERDFERFAKVLGLPCLGGDKTMIMGEKLGRQINKAVGDSVNDDASRVFGFNEELKIAATYGESAYGVPGAYTFFRVDSSFALAKGEVPRSILLLREDGDAGEIEGRREGFKDTIANLKELYPDLVYADYEANDEYVRATFTSFWPFIMVILVIIGVLITITAAGIFSVLLQKRDSEFGVYTALGFSRFRVLMKGVSEVFLINMISICIAFLLIFLTVYLLNMLLLFDRGLELYYFSSMSAAAFVSCNAAMFLSLLFMQVRWILRSALVR